MKMRHKIRRERTRFQKIGRALLWLVILSALLALALWFVNRTDENGNKKTSFFAIQSITVEGNTHYTDEEIISVGEVYPGESVLTLNKNKLKTKLIENFAYIADVEITQGKNFRDVTITITEQAVFGAAYHESSWLLIGMDGRLLEKRPVRSDLPERYLYLKLSSIPENAAIGDHIISETDQNNIEKILSACAQKGIGNIRELDVSNRGDLQFNWNNRLVIKLGNNSNITHQIAVVAVTIPKIDAKYGETSTGALDLRSYSDPASDNNYAVFTPEELLPTTTYPVGSSTTTTTATGTTTKKR